MKLSKICKNMARKDEELCSITASEQLGGRWVVFVHYRDSLHKYRTRTLNYQSFEIDVSPDKISDGSIAVVGAEEGKYYICRYFMGFYVNTYELRGKNHG